MYTCHMQWKTCTPLHVAVECHCHTFRMQPSRACMLGGFQNPYSSIVPQSNLLTRINMALYSERGVCLLIY